LPEIDCLSVNRLFRFVGNIAGKSLTEGIINLTNVDMSSECTTTLAQKSFLKGSQKFQIMK
jgi:hypothetical protein